MLPNNKKKIKFNLSNIFRQTENISDFITVKPKIGFQDR